MGCKMQKLIMKIGFCLAFVLLLGANTVLASNNVTLMSSDVNESVLKFTIEDYDFKEVKTAKGPMLELLVPDTGKMMKKGAPALPKMAASVLIPDSAGMAVDVVGADFVELNDIDLAPSKGNLTRDVDPDDLPYTFGKQYKKNAFYPKKLARLRTPHIVRDFRGQTVVVHPFMYNPVAKVLRIYTEIVVRVSDTGRTGENVYSRQKALEKTSKRFKDVYSRHFINYNQAKSYYTSYRTLNDDIDNMLIVCYSGFMDEMADFVAWKQSLGYNVELVNYSNIGSSSSLKSYVANYYNNNGLTYLLLVGDHQQVPSSSTSSGDSDNNYGYITGGDKYQDIFVGRFSAENSGQVETQVERTIHYERDLQSSAGFFKKAIGSGSSQGPGHNNEMDYEHINKILSDLDGDGYSTNTCHQSGGSTSQMTSLINAGAGTIFYAGHGSTSGWASLSYSISDVNSLSNRNELPFVVSVACVVGNFTSSTCFCESWQRATSGGSPTGAIANCGSTINQSWIPPMDAQDEMADLLVQGSVRTFGGMFVNGLFKMIDINGSSGEQVADTWVCFGDPSVQMRTPGNPDGPEEGGGPDLYTLKVYNGSGDGSFEAGEDVKITANSAPSGQEFDHWVVNSGSPQIDNKNASSTILTMPAGNVSVTATYKEQAPVYDLTVVSGSGDGSFEAGEDVKITANSAPSGQEFDHWVVNSGSPQIADVNASSTTLTMPASNVSVTATYKEQTPVYDLAVVNGSGDGSYEAGEKVSITAAAAPSGQEFDHWVVNSGSPQIADKNASSTILTMPAGNVSVTATYKDQIPVYDLQVVNGTGNGKYEAGDYVSITAAAAPTGYVFDQWVENSGSPQIDDKYASRTTLKMPARNVSITATYKPNHALKVNRGTGDGNFAEGEEVYIRAVIAPSGQVFDQWVVNSGNPQIADVNAANTTLIMPAGPVEVTATYTGSCSLSVVSGSGDGDYAVGTEVWIKADAAPLGQVFVCWVESSGHPQIADVNEASTKLTMPANNVTVTATYKDDGGGNDYCASWANDYSLEWITSVHIGSLDNTSGAGASGYSDFTSQTLNASANETIAVSLTPGFIEIFYMEYWKIWIDYNHDGDFEDSGEEVFSESGNSTVSGSFTVPATASGATRMRVSMSYGIAPSCCGTFSCGEVEDYMVNIGDGTQYTLSVFGGGGDGLYKAGENVTILADSAPSGQMFGQWVVNSGSPQIADKNASSTTLTMPAGNVAVIATYKDPDYALKVYNGGGDGNYEAGENVIIVAAKAPLGQVFDQWVVNWGLPQIADVNAANTTLIMPAGSVELEATYKDPSLQEYSLSVVSGSGGGDYKACTEVMITAGAAPSGQVFVCWVVNSGHPQIADVNEASTNLTMPASNAAVTATYKDKGGGNDYCASWANEYSQEWITGVHIGFLDNTSGAGASGYSDFTSQTLNVSANETVVVSLTPGFGNEFYMEYWKIWIDYNHDGDFEDSGEEVFSKSGNYTVSGSFTVPATATGATRMRVSMSYDIAPSCCGTFSCGEVEDYTVDIGGGTQTYTLSVSGGSGDGSYQADSRVTIKANTAPSGQVFDQWVVNSGSPQIADVNASSTILIMPAGNVSVTATYKDQAPATYALIVGSGSGDGSYVVGAYISITADKAPSGREFDQWVVNSGSPQIADVNASSTTLIMPAGNVSVTAAYKDLTPLYTLIVVGGSGDGSYESGTKVNITVDEAPFGKEFDKWEVSSGDALIDDVSEPGTTLTMPANAVTVTAIYKDVAGGGPEGYTWCASENQSYSFTETVDVAYGANGQFYYKYGVTGTITFNNATFGDPIAGVVKAGYYKSSDLYTLTVVGGDGDGGYAAGTIVTITAEGAPSGQVFDKWVVNSGSAVIADVKAPVTTLSMPANAATITASYKDAGGGGAGTITRQVWTGISGTAIAALTGNANYPDNPSITDELGSFEAPVNWADNYGTRIVGYLHAPVTGTYTFWIASDDNGELWLSTDDSAGNKERIAYVPGWTSSRQWTKYTVQKSVEVYLTAGQRYYIEALQKEAGGDDNLAVAWQIPGGSQEVIPGDYLSSYDGQGDPGVIEIDSITVSQPDSATWHQVGFDKDFVEAPIVVMGPLSYNGKDPTTVRVRNITVTGFEFQLDEWDYKDGTHTTETLSFMAMTPGTHQWGGMTVTAGSIDNVDHQWKTVNYAQGFSSTPVVIAQQVSNNDGQATAIRLKDISTTSFAIALQEEELSRSIDGGVHAYEQVNYVAVTQGTGSADDYTINAGLTGKSVNQDWYQLDFGDMIVEPYILAAMQTYNGGDTATLRYRGLTETGVKIKVEEEKSKDIETSHCKEVVGWLVITPF